MEDADIGLIGLAVMGQNLVLNMNDHGFRVVVFNRTTSKVDDFLKGPAKGTKILGAHSLEELISLLKRPRRIMFMIKAGPAIDAIIEELLPHLSPGDIIIDGGNSNYRDSQRRHDALKAKGFLYIGTGISGGEEGARHGPSIMPGGNPEAWPHVKALFQGIAAKADNGEPCCDWVGDGGAGHYVKMVHNGIEYGDMQIICEAYHLMKSLLGFSNAQMQEVFAQWNQKTLNSYLIEITSNILAFKEKGAYLLDAILDAAGQKGTGKWTGISALELNTPVTLIAEAVFARDLSAMKEERVALSALYPSQMPKFDVDAKTFTQALADALYASKIISYAQGFMLMRQAAQEMKWNLNYGSIALMWRGGCIIRSAFLGKIKEAFTRDPQLKSLLFDAFFQKAIVSSEKGWRLVVAKAAQYGIPAPCFSTALCFFDGYRTERLPANLLQAQRDYFGAHTYERLDSPRGKFFHTHWVA